MLNNRQLLIDIGQGLSLMVGLPTIITWKTADRPKNATSGTFGFNLQTKNLEYWNGSSWLVAPMVKA